MLRINKSAVVKAMANRDIYTQTALAQQSGIPMMTISHLLDGKHSFRSSTVDKLAAALGVSPLDLLTDGKRS